jgi:PhnB protein
MAAVNPYLIFNGKCEEAFNLYKSVFGGEFQGGIMRFGQAPPSESPVSEEEANHVMHVVLPIGNTVLMGSDTSSAHGDVSTGTNFWVSITADSEEEADRIFKGLSAGGKVTMPMEKTFWGAYFGMFSDKFGINWMVNYDYK